MSDDEFVGGRQFFHRRNRELLTWKRLRETFQHFSENEHEFSDALHEAKLQAETLSWDELKRFYLEWCQSNNRLP